MTEPADLRAKLLAWIDAEAVGLHPSLPFARLARALRGEVELHHRLVGWTDHEGTVVPDWCGACESSDRSTAWPCPALTRIASQLGVEK